MAIQLLQIPVTERLNFKANQTIQIRLPRGNPIRRLNFDFRMVLSAGNTAPTGPKNENWINAIKRIKIQGGTTVLFSMSALDKFTLDRIEHGADPVRSALSTPGANASGSEMSLLFSHDFSLTRKDLRNLGQILLPARYSDLILEIEWGDIGDIYNTVGNGSIDEDNSYLEVSLIGAYDDGRGGEGISIPENPAVIREIARNDVPITQAFESLDGDNKEISITPTGNTILRQLIFARKNITDQNPSLADDVIKMLQFQDIRGGRELYLRDSWARLKSQMKTDFYLNSGLPGILLIDWADARAGGLFVPATEALKLQLTTEAPAANKENAVRIVERFI